MIIVEADVDSLWEGPTDWRGIADEAARAAVRFSHQASLAEAGLDVEISVKFTSDDVVQALNAGYRNKNRPTNVLSFPMIEPDLLESIAAAEGSEILLGDVVLAHDVCVREAAEKGIGIDQHAAHLVVHGVLHLLGYDHEQGEDKAEAMEKVEREALASIGIADPYTATEVQTQ
jgi:probable rRNA maturation factor